MTIRLEWLRTFVTVARAGALAQAAEHLGRTPSAVSMALHQLEAALGVPLFETDRKSRLTRVGTAVLTEAQRAVDQFDQSVDAIRQHARSEAGFLRIAAVPSVATTILPEAVADLRRDHPGIRVEIHDMDSQSVVQALLAGRVDIGLATLAVAHQAIVAKLLWEDQFEVLMPERHPYARRSSLTISDIAGEIFISNGLCEAIAHHEVRELVLRSSISARNTTSLLAMVRAGLGITLLPKLLGPLAGLTFVPLSDVASLRQLHILTLRHTLPSPAHTLFLAILARSAAALQ
jgi:DNA-binding transcriptional LysR family regulator